MIIFIYFFFFFFLQLLEWLNYIFDIYIILIFKGDWNYIQMELTIEIIFHSI